jgi:Pro-kumamolisin, activation domain/Bacterial Ig-like domain (group 3)/Subtilase family
MIGGVKKAPTMRWEALLLVAGSMFSVPVVGQTPATPLVTRAIDSTKLVTLHGNVHPLARARYDAGVADTAMLSGRLMLLLDRPADREAALTQYMQDVHAPGSAAYHQWLTPEEFGNRFGPADSDIEQVSGWLNEMGFQVTGASKSKALIEFSGNVGQVNRAFRTEIHKYAVNGVVNYANATDPQIPEALASLVRGVSSLNNFRPRSNLHVVGSAHVDPATRKISPDDNLNGPDGPFHGVGPEDFATQYDLAPLYSAGTNGSGKTIGIINDSNIDVNLAAAYRSMFNLPANAVQVVLDGGDPGITGDAEEAYLDVEMAGAVAPGAAVNLYIASWDTVANALNDPLILAARRAIEDNQADVLSLSFGECEAGIGLADNQILAALWEQAAAQGQTVFVSAGDGGSAGCDDPNSTQSEALDGLAVNGFASTPWNIAVGGTDFYYSDYATGGASASGLWNAVDDANLGSLKAPLPEQVWNNTYGFDIVNPDSGNTVYVGNIIAGGGGASGCINPTIGALGLIVPFICNPAPPGTLSGYAKPSWQSAPGVPADGVRDLPDVSLFAANGSNLSAYVICASPGDCVSGSNQQTPVSVVGGTSSAAPAMAGIMALIDQKYGRQGQANYTLYPLAQQKPSAFHDITVGGNNVPCLQGYPNCVFVTNSYGFNYTLSGYPATTGYDLATGLGSIDANVLVNNWNSLAFASTATSLQLSSTSFPHGTPVTATASVTSPGSATPQGGVSILTNSLLPADQSVGLLTLGSNGSASASLTSLPGGSYQLWANYGGDGIHFASHSSPVSVTVTPEASTLSLSGWNTGSTVTQNPAMQCSPVVGDEDIPVPSGSSTYLGVPLWLSVQPAGAVSNTTAATGTATFTLDGQPATVALNVSGIATWAVPLLGAGLHTATASYSGDASYAASMSPAFTYTVMKSSPDLQISPGGVCNAKDACSLYAGDSLPVEVYLRGQGCFVPTGIVTVTLGTQTQTVTLSPAGHPVGQVLTGLTSFSNLQAGTYPLSAAYTGDINYSAASYPPTYSVVVAPVTGPRVATTTVVSESASVLAYNNGGVSFTVTVTGGSGSNGPPTGSVTIAQNGFELFGSALTPSGPHTATGSAGTAVGLGVGSPLFNFGLNEITAIYTGDSTYQGSVSAAIPLTYVTSAVTADFTLAPQLNQVTVPAGSSEAVGVNLAAYYGFTGAVALSCAPSSTEVACTINPGTVTVNGQAAAMVTITVAAQTVGIAANEHHPARWPMAAGCLAFSFFLAGGRARRRLGRSVLLSLCIAAMISAIGCGSKTPTATTSTQPPASTPAPALVPYSVVITGTGSGITHTAKIIVAVP